MSVEVRSAALPSLVSYLSTTDDHNDTQVDTLIEEAGVAKAVAATCSTGGAGTAAGAASDEPWGKLMPLWGQQVPLLLERRAPEASYLFGRGADADVRVADKRISARHCRLSRTAAGATLLEDLGAANGVYVRRAGHGTHRLRRLEVFALRNGDQIMVLKLRRRDAAKAVAGKPFTYMYVERTATPPLAGVLPGVPPITVPNEAGAELSPSPVPDAAVNDKYAIFGVLGRGACGVVYRAACRTTGRGCAVKAIRFQSYNGAANATMRSLAREAELLQKLDHPSIIKLYEVLSGPSHLYLVMELVAGGDLFDRVVDRKHLSEGAARGLTRSILEAVAHLHAHNVVHRDLKLENILMVARDDDVAMKLTDFGLAAQLNTDGLRTFCGTPQYFAPEVLRRRNTTHGLGRYGHEADMWSVGVILYILLCGHPPFRADQLERQIATGELSFTSPVWSRVSSGAVDLVRKLIEVSPKRRLSATAALQHPWITGEAMDAGDASGSAPLTTTAESTPTAPPSAGETARADAPNPKPSTASSSKETTSAVSKADALAAPGSSRALHPDPAKRKRSYECERLESWRTRFTNMGGREGLVRPVASPGGKLNAKRRRTGP